MFGDTAAAALDLERRNRSKSKGAAVRCAGSEMLSIAHTVSASNPTLNNGRRTALSVPPFNAQP